MMSFKITAPIMEDVTNMTMPEIKQRYGHLIGLKRRHDRVLAVVGAVTINPQKYYNEGGI